MSSRISVRVAGGQVVHVPPLRLDAASAAPRLVALLDQLRSHDMLTQEGLNTPDELELFREFVKEVCAYAKYDEKDGAVDCDLRDVSRLYAALRGVEAPDPTPPPSG